MLRILANHHIEGIEQSLHITLFNKRCPQVRHKDIPHEHHIFVGKINQLAPSNRDQLELRSADIYVRSTVDRDVRFVVHNILRVESLSEELLCENLWPVKFL